MMPQQPSADPLLSTNGDGMGMAPPPPTIYTRDQIVEMVNQHEKDMEPLRQRMEGDYDQYRLVEHMNRDLESGDVLTGYAVYTSNEPRAFADKIISWGVMAELLLRVPHLEVGQHEAEADNLKERFAIGCLKAADERLIRALQPTLRGQQSFFTAVRGGYVGGRCLLVKRPDGSTYPDITAWDPMHIHWSVSPDGLEWVCYKIKKTRAQIKREYGIEVGGTYLASSGDGDNSIDAEKEGIPVYDFYDGMVNWVFTDGEDLKPPTPHGSPRVPVYLVLMGPTPLLQSEAASNLVADVGESVYAGARKVYEKYNDIMSIMLEIVQRARRQTVITESADGKKTLPFDPFKQGTEIATRSGEKIYTLELQQMAREAGAYMGLVSGEIQRVTLPHTAYGELEFQLSGFAINTLRQGIETVLASSMKAMSQMYLQIANLLYDQFMTGAFDGIKLSGRDSSRSYFNQTITPQELQGTCDYTTEMVSQLPEDDVSKWAMAKIATDGRFLSRVDILDNIVGIQDSQQAIDKVKLEMAERGLPEAIMYDMMMAAANRGEFQIAQLYLMEYQRIMAVKMGLVPPAPADGGGEPGGQRPAPQGGGGQRPEVMPRAATGAPPPRETSNDGPSRVAPRTPRPRARR